MPKFCPASHMFAMRYTISSKSLGVTEDADTAQDALAKAEALVAQGAEDTIIRNEQGHRFTVQEMARVIQSLNFG
jgi:hypothetical protein